jgi:hypothetical protein
MQTLAQEQDTFATLAELLRDNGAVQMYVAQQEQTRIVGEVNAVLAKLDDPLTVQLGDPRRRARVAFQDILVQDRRDRRLVACVAEPRDTLEGRRFRPVLARRAAAWQRVAWQNRHRQREGSQ